MNATSYFICASTCDASVAVIRTDPADALAKLEEFAALGLLDVAVTTGRGQIISRDQLERMTTRRHTPPSGAS